jgi:hypothetical protein
MEPDAFLSPGRRITVEQQQAQVARVDAEGHGAPPWGSLESGRIQPQIPPD